MANNMAAAQPSMAQAQVSEANNADWYETVNESIIAAQRQKAENDRKLDSLVQMAELSMREVEALLSSLKLELSQSKDAAVKAKIFDDWGKNPLVLFHYRSVHSAGQTARILQGESAGSDGQPTHAEQQSPTSKRRLSIGGEKVQTTVAVVAKTDEPIDIAKIVNRTSVSNKIQLAGLKLNEKGCKMVLYSREDAMSMVNELKQQVAGSRTLDNWYDFNLCTENIKQLRTKAIGRPIFLSLPFMEDGMLNLEGAKDTLVECNPRWFKSNADIDSVEVRTLPGRKETKHILELSISERAYSEFARSANDGKASVNLGLNAPIDIFMAVKESNCFKCQKPGHWMKDCPANQPLCKYCSERHFSRNCPSKDKKKELKCSWCIEENWQRSRLGKKLLDVHHASSSTECPGVRERLREMRREEQRRQDYNDKMRKYGR